jgi:hypothetical protein
MFVTRSSRLWRNSAATSPKTTHPWMLKLEVLRSFRLQLNIDNSKATPAPPSNDFANPCWCHRLTNEGVNICDQPLTIGHIGPANCSIELPPCIRHSSALEVPCVVPMNDSSFISVFPWVLVCLLSVCVLWPFSPKNTFCVTTPVYETFLRCFPLLYLNSW